MAKLYKARLFRLMLENEQMSQYEAYRVGMVIVSRRGKNCKEFLYGAKIPVFDSKRGKISESCEHIGGFHVHFYDVKDAEDEYIILREDLSEKNLMTKKDLIKFDYDHYAEGAMYLLKADKTPFKRLFKTKNGVVYGRVVERS